MILFAFSQRNYRSGVDVVVGSQSLRRCPVNLNRPEQCKRRAAPLASSARASEHKLFPPGAPSTYISFWSNGPKILNVHNAYILLKATNLRETEVHWWIGVQCLRNINPGNICPSWNITQLFYARYSHPGLVWSR